MRRRWMPIHADRKRGAVRYPAQGGNQLLKKNALGKIRNRATGAQRFLTFRCGQSVAAAVGESHASSRKNRFRISHLVRRRQNSLFASATMRPKMPPIPQRQAGRSVLAHPHAFRSPESTSPDAFFPNKLNLTSGKYGEGKYGDDYGKAAYARPSCPGSGSPYAPGCESSTRPFFAQTNPRTDRKHRNRRRDATQMCHSTAPISRPVSPICDTQEH